MCTAKRILPTATLKMVNLNKSKINKKYALTKTCTLKCTLLFMMALVLDALEKNATRAPSGSGCRPVSIFQPLIGRVRPAHLLRGQNSLVAPRGEALGQLGAMR